jgi:hypothetical protein
MAGALFTTHGLLIAAPLVVLATVLLLGFAGCDFHPGTIPPDPPPPPPTLRFRARVPTTLTVTAGVTFGWTRPTMITESQVVTAFTVDGTDNVYEHEIPAPEAGAWIGRCEMDVIQIDLLATSVDFPFLPDFAVNPNPVLAFHTEGSPTTPPFTIVVDGLI